MAADDVGRDNYFSPYGFPQFYIYNGLAELDSPGEYYVDHATGVLSFLPPKATLPRGGVCEFAVPITSWGTNGSDVPPGKVWKVLNVTGPGEDMFDINDCSAQHPDAATRCPGIAAGVSFVKNRMGVIVGTGNCCACNAATIGNVTRSKCTRTVAAVGTYHVSLLESLVVATGAANVRFAGFEFRHVRGSGIVLDNCTNVTVSDGVIADVGMVGLNISNGAGCGAVDTTIAGCGDTRVILSGGDRRRQGITCTAARCTSTSAGS
jgi:hypothetical protein